LLALRLEAAQTLQYLLLSVFTKVCVSMVLASSPELWEERAIAEFYNCTEETIRNS